MRLWVFTVADPGFPTGARTNPRGGAPFYYGQKNDKYCMKKKEIGPKGETDVPNAPPPRSANDLATIGNRFSFGFLR